MTFGFEAIGTAWTIELFEYPSDMHAGEIVRAVRQRISEFDSCYSRFRSDSLVAQMSRQAGKYRLPDDAKPLFDIYRKLYDLSGGAVTPLIGQVLADAGYDARYSFHTGAPSLPPGWDEVLKYNFPMLEVRRPALLDLGAAGKGYLADIISQLLAERGIGSSCVNAGGDIVYSGTDQAARLEIALEDPADPDRAIGVASVTTGSLCGSAGNRRAWGNYHHIIDPRTLQSPRHIRAVWVYASSGLVSDGLCTALYFVPPELLARAFRFSYAILSIDDRLSYSDDFPAIFYSTA